MTLFYQTETAYRSIRQPFNSDNYDHIISLHYEMVPRCFTVLSANKENSSPRIRWTPLNPISTGRFFTHFVLGGGAFFAPPLFSETTREITIRLTPIVL